MTMMKIVGDYETARPRVVETVAALEAQPLAVLRHLFPGGIIDGDHYCVGDPQGEAGGGLKINLNGKIGVWSDGSCDDLLELWAYALCGGDLASALQNAWRWLANRSMSGVRPRRFRKG
jgi:hypothetical protein